MEARKSPKKAILPVGVVKSGEEKVLKDPAPAVSITAADAAAITFGLYAHVNNADLGTVQAALTEKIKLALTAKGIWA